MKLEYGFDAQLSCEVDADRIPLSPVAPPANPQFVDELQSALAHPLDFPPLAQLFIPGDRVTLALDRSVPESAALVSAVWQVLAEREISPGDVVIVQPAGADDEPIVDPRSQLPAEIRQSVRWSIHDPSDSDCCRYLAATASGERIYLARELIESDVVVAIGRIAFDPVVGCRGTNSVFYPSLSNSDAIRRAQGLGHSELKPDDVRPLRQTMDEVGWLLGTQFAVQVIPSMGGGVCSVLAGASDSVFRKGREILAEHWLVELDIRPEIVVVAVENDAGGHRWEQVSAAIAAARSLVAQGGKIVVLSELAADLGPGMQLLRQYPLPRDAIQPLQELAPADFVEAAQLVYAADWANIYFVSKLASDLIEDLFMIPIANETEIVRLLSGSESCLFIGAAQFAYGVIEPR